MIAHLSEGIPRHWLIDNSSLESFLANELEYGLQTAVEAKVLADVNGTVGIQTQAYATSVLTDAAQGHHQARGGRLHRVRVRAAPDRLGGCRARAVERERDRAPGPAVRSGHPSAVRCASGHHQRAGCRRRHVLASGAVALDTDTRGVDVQWSENATADSFGKNLVFARCESRYATSVFSPLGIVSLDLTP